MLLSSLAVGGGDEEDADAGDEAADVREGPCTSIRNEIHPRIKGHREEQETGGGSG
jgi:hypothetical protein